MAEVKQIQIQVTAPSRRLPAGAAAIAYYTVNDKKVTLTDQGGIPLHDPEGKGYSREMADNETSREVAGRLLRDFRMKVKGSQVSGFSGPLNYGPGPKY